MYLTTVETTLPDVESGECGYIELDTDGYLTLPNDKVGSLALSFWVKSNTNANIYVSDKSSTSTNEWKHVSFIFVSDGSDVDIKFSPANYYIYKVKMEEGSKITGWSLSPDDVLNNIDTLTVRMSKAEQLISPDAIVSTVKNSEMYQDDINGIRGRLDVAEQKITKDAIVSTVKSGIDGEFLVSEINQSAGQVLIKADRIELDGDVLVNKIVAKGDVIDQVNSELLLEGNSIALTTGHFTIDSENFKLDSAGNAEFSGEIKGSYGEFTEGFYLNSKELLQNGYHADQIMRVENGEFELTYTCKEASKDKDPSDPYYAEHWFTNSIRMNQNGITINSPWIQGASVDPKVIIDAPEVKIGTTSSSKVSVPGWLNVTGMFTNPSDRRIKHNIRYLTDIHSSEIINELKPCSFNYNLDDSDRTYFGFIAQDVEDILEKHGMNIDKSSLIRKDADMNNKSEDPTEYYSLNYVQFIPLIIDAYQELYHIVSELKQKLE